MSVFDSQTKSHRMECIPQQAKNLGAISCIDYTEVEKHVQVERFYYLCQPFFSGLRKLCLTFNKFLVLKNIVVL